MDKKIKWAPIIPLIGGFPLGAYQATKEKPTHIISYKPFERNDNHLVQYWHDVPYVQIDNEDHKSILEDIDGYDLMVATPPCAGLSMLNTGKHSGVKGADAGVNDWIYESATYAIEHWRPKVFMGENAPGLYTKRGEGVVNKLREIADRYGYSLSLYKTNSLFHGLPQSRDRCFYFLWDSKNAPIANWVRITPPTFSEYLSKIPENAPQQDLIINQNLTEEPYYQFVKSHFKCDDARDVIGEVAKTAHGFVMKKKLLDEFVLWCEKYHPKGYELGLHAQKKYGDNKGVWDSSTHVFKDYMNAVIGRNLQDTIHPEEDRSLNVREALHMMGFPHDFILQNGLKAVNHIAQNVPVNTAGSMVRLGIDFVNGYLDISNQNFVRQDNYKRVFENEEKQSLEEFF